MTDPTSRAWLEESFTRQPDRGMAIVATLSRRTGCDSTTGGKVTWAELSA